MRTTSLLSAVKWILGSEIDNEPLTYVDIFCEASP